MCIKFRVQKQNRKKNRNDEKYNHTGITVKIHTNHDGIITTVLTAHRSKLLISISGHCSEESLKNYISRPSSFMFLWIILSFIHKTNALSSLFSNCQVKKTCLFLLATIWREFTKHFIFRVCTKTKKTWGIIVKLDLQNFCRLWTLMVWHFWQL